MTRHTSRGHDLVSLPELPGAIRANTTANTDQPATVLFVDMIGFTTFCAENYPAMVVEVLRDLLSLLSEQVLSHGGTVEKYLGDGLMAIFDGAQLRSQDATNAVRCAIGMHQAIVRWNGVTGRHGDEAIQIAVGINTGRVIVGAVGSGRHQEKAVFGDVVNIASRVEGKCRCLNAAILVTSQVIDKIDLERRGEPFSFTNFGFHELRGRAGYVHLYGLPRSHRTVAREHRSGGGGTGAGRAETA